MLVREICESEVITVEADEPVIDAARRMRDEHVGCLVVIEPFEGRGLVPIGILTDRDLVLGVVATIPERVETVRVRDVMTVDPVTVRGRDSVMDAVEVMRQSGVRRVPVTGPEGELVGIMALDDVLEMLAEQLSALAELVGRGQDIEYSRT